MASGYYDITNKTLGKGHYGVVKLARHCLTGEPVAIKIIEKSRLNNDGLNQLGTEIRILFRLSEFEHPNILKLYQTIDTEDKIFLVTEYCGPHACDLHDYLLRKHSRNGLSEREAQIFFVQICSAISYCHSMGIVHRDLKPENILVTDYRHLHNHPMERSLIHELQYPLLKLIDFGFANQWYPDEKMRTSCGTLAYSAPELLLGEPYDGTKVDVWGLGLMLYILLYGGNPFMQINDNETLTKILDCSFATPTRDNVNYDAIELLRSLIKRNPDTRLPIDAILQHKWFSSLPYRPTSPDLVGRSGSLSEEERIIHDHVIQEIFSLTKLIDSKSSIEASLKNARSTHGQFHKNSIESAQLGNVNISTGLASNTKTFHGDLVYMGDSPKSSGDKLGVINRKLSNDEYIYATYQLTRGRILRAKQEQVNRRAKEDKDQDTIPEEDVLDENDEDDGGEKPEMETGTSPSLGEESDKMCGTDSVTAKENDSFRLTKQTKLLQPQHKMRDKFTSFFRPGSTSPSGSAASLYGNQESQQHEAFSDQNNETSGSTTGRYLGSKLENAFALPLARKCSLVSEESGCSNDLPSDNQ